MKISHQPCCRHSLWRATLKTNVKNKPLYLHSCRANIVNNTTLFGQLRLRATNQNERVEQMDKEGGDFRWIARLEQLAHHKFGECGTINQARHMRSRLRLKCAINIIY